MEKRDFLFKGGIADGIWMQVPVDENGKPACRYWRVHEQIRPRVLAYSSGAEPVDPMIKVQDYVPVRTIEDGIEDYIFKAV